MMTEYKEIPLNDEVMNGKVEVIVEAASKQRKSKFGKALILGMVLGVAAVLVFFAAPCSHDDGRPVLPFFSDGEEIIEDDDVVLFGTNAVDFWDNKKNATKKTGYFLRGNNNVTRPLTPPPFPLPPREPRKGPRGGRGGMGHPPRFDPKKKGPPPPPPFPHKGHHKHHHGERPLPKKDMPPHHPHHMGPDHHHHGHPEKVKGPFAGLWGKHHHDDHHHHHPSESESESSDSSSEDSSSSSASSDEEELEEEEWVEGELMDGPAEEWVFGEDEEEWDEESEEEWDEEEESEDEWDEEEEESEEEWSEDEESEEESEDELVDDFQIDALLPDWLPEDIEVAIPLGKDEQPPIEHDDMEVFPIIYDDFDADEMVPPVDEPALIPEDFDIDEAMPIDEQMEVDPVEEPALIDVDPVEEPARVEGEGEDLVTAQEVMEVMDNNEDVEVFRMEDGH